MMMKVDGVCHLLWLIGFYLIMNLQYLLTSLQELVPIRLMALAVTLLQSTYLDEVQLQALLHFAKL